MANVENVTIGDILNATKGPTKSLMNLVNGMPDIAAYANRLIAIEVIKNAKAYLRHQKKPYEVSWQALWRNEKGTGLYNWTPEFNKKNRKSSTNRTNDDQMFDTGALAESITIITASSGKSKKSFVTVGSKLPYAHLLEVGGTNSLGKSVPARPYLVPAILEVYEKKAFAKFMRSELKRAVAEVMRSGKKPPRIEVPH